MKSIKLALTFYKSFSFASLCITLLCLYIYKYWQFTPVILVVLFWFKIATYLLTIYHIKQAKHKEFFYYQALGISKTTLWIISLLFDFSSFVILMLATNRLYHA